MFLKNIRVECDTSNAKISYKIREGTLEKIPYLLIVGDKEVQTGTVAVRSRKKGDEGPFLIDEFIKKVELEIKEKR